MPAVNTAGIVTFWVHFETCVLHVCTILLVVQKILLVVQKILLVVQKRTGNPPENMISYGVMLC